MSRKCDMLITYPLYVLIDAASLSLNAVKSRMNASLTSGVGFDVRRLVSSASLTLSGSSQT